MSSDGLHTSALASCGCVEGCVDGCDETNDADDRNDDDDDDDDVAACVVCVRSIVCFCGMGMGCWLNSSTSSSGVGYEASAGFSTRTALNGETVETVETVEPIKEMEGRGSEDNGAEG